MATEVVGPFPCYPVVQRIVHAEPARRVHPAEDIYTMGPGIPYMLIWCMCVLGVHGEDPCNTQYRGIWDTTGICVSGTYHG